MYLCKMKYAIFILFTLFALHVECGRRKKFEPEETCATELHLRKSKMKFIINEINTPEDNQTYGEFFFCVFNKRNIMEENGMINEVYFRNFLRFVFHGSSNGTETETANVNRVFDICIRSTRDTKFKTATNLKNCISRYLQELETNF